MKRFTLAAIAIIAAVGLSACTATSDGRTGLRGELCAFGYCLAPQAMAATSAPVPQTSVFAGPVVAPATVVSQPAFASAAVIEQRSFAAAPACAAPAAPVTTFPAPPPQRLSLEK